MNWDEISDQEVNFVSICQNNNNHINIINSQGIEDSSELLLVIVVEKIAKLKQQWLDRLTSIEDLEVYQTFFNFI